MEIHGTELHDLATASSSLSPSQPYLTANLGATSTPGPRNEGTSAPESFQDHDFASEIDEELPSYEEACVPQLVPSTSPTGSAKVTERTCCGLSRRLFFALVAAVVMIMAIGLGLGLGVGLHHASSSSSLSADNQNVAEDGLYSESNFATVTISDSDGSLMPIVFYQDPFGFLMLTHQSLGVWTSINITGTSVHGYDAVLGTPLAAAAIPVTNTSSVIYLFYLQSTGELTPIKANSNNMSMWSPTAMLPDQFVQSGTQLSVTTQCCGEPPEADASSYFLIVAFQNSTSLIYLNSTLSVYENGSVTAYIQSDPVVIDSMASGTGFALLPLSQGGSLDTVYAIYIESSTTFTTKQLPDGSIFSQANTGYNYQGQSIAATTTSNGTEVILVTGGGWLGYVGDVAGLTNWSNIHWDSIDYTKSPSVTITKWITNVALADESHFYAIADGAIMEFSGSIYTESFDPDEIQLYAVEYISNLTLPLNGA
ncbi:hypothetical protein BX600DRAFT_517594 [Xylariales sp. PMI_506]|nr:hypothetical protein BX600DRAFT_517594 [Xylariales sp. PMI_506]